jgi:hypothetical protein
VTPPADTERLAKHVVELGRSPSEGQRAILLVCFLYDNPGFVVRPSGHHAEVRAQPGLRTPVRDFQGAYARHPGDGQALGSPGR